MTAPAAAITADTNIQDTATFGRREAAAATPSPTLDTAPPPPRPRPRRVAVLGGNCVMADHREQQQCQYQADVRIMFQLSRCSWVR